MSFHLNNHRLLLPLRPLAFLPGLLLLAAPPAFFLFLEPALPVILKSFFFFWRCLSLSLTLSRVLLPSLPPLRPMGGFPELNFSKSSSAMSSPRSRIFFFNWLIDSKFSLFSVCFAFILKSFNALWNFLFSSRYFFSSNVLIFTCCFRSLLLT